MAQTAAIVIAGAGIAGLGTALGLARKGFAVSLIDRRAVLSEAGAGIQIGPNGVRALAMLGVREAVETVAFRPSGLGMYQGTSGAKLTTLPFASNRYDAPYLTLMRSDLQAALLAAVKAQPRIDLQLGFEVSRIFPGEDGVAVESADGRAVPGSALIGADGLWSRVRAEVNGSEPSPTGYAAYRALVPRAGLPAALDAPEVGLWIGPEAHVVHYPVRDGALLNLVVVVDGHERVRDWDEPGRLGDITPHLGRWPALGRVLERAPEWRRWTLYDLPAHVPWVKGRMAVIGDAAHPVLPFLGQGAVMALEDAVALSEIAAAAGGATPQALARFEQARAPRAHRLAAASRDNGRTYHMAGISAAVRDAVLRLTPPGLLLSRFDWLYGFDPASYSNAASKP